MQEFFAQVIYKLDADRDIDTFAAADVRLDGTHYSTGRSCNCARYWATAA